MNNETNSCINKLVQDLVIYHANLGLAICRPCKVGFLLDVELHLSKHHKTLCVSERQALAHYIESLPGRRSLEDINIDLCNGIEIKAIPGLAITEAWKCNQCTMVGAKTTVQKHCREHTWTIGEGNTYCIFC